MAVYVAVVAEAIVVASRGPHPQRTRKPTHAQTELHICRMATLQLWHDGRLPNMFQPHLQPPLPPHLQDKEVGQEDLVALAKGSEEAECDDRLEVALAKELGLDRVLSS